MADNRIERTVDCIETFKVGYATLREEQFNKEDISDFVDLFPEYGLRISLIYHFLNGDLNINVDDEVTDEDNDDSSEEYAEETIVEGRPSRRGMKYIKITKLDAENISKYVAEKCRGRADLNQVAREVKEYLNDKFNEKSILRLIRGETHATISQNYFRIVANKIKAV